MTDSGWTGERWSAYVAAVSARLAASIDYDATVTCIARVALPDFATWCVLRVPEAEGVTVRVAHIDPARQALANAAAQQMPVEPDGQYGPVEVMQTGRPIVWSSVPDSLLSALAQKPEHLQLLRTLGCRSYIVVPLQVDGRQFGTLTFVSASEDRRYGQPDLARAQDIAARCAMAFESARRYRIAIEAVGARDELLASAAHDLRAPLTSIKAYAQSLRMRVGRALPRSTGPSSLDSVTVLERLDRIDATATRMALLIDDLTDIARLQLGLPLVLDRQWVDLPQLVRRVSQEHERATGRTIHITGRRRDISGWWDAARLERVLDNLLGNAIKFSPDGEDVSVELRTEEGSNGQVAVIAVTDRGVGIPSEDLPRLFDHFQRGSNVDGKITGTGVGLSIADQIVKLHGGRISVDSRLGEQTTLTVRLPLAVEDSAIAA